MGENVYQLDTPCLLLDEEKMKQNIQQIQQFGYENSLAFRPHIKTHKSVEIAKRQMESGAVGITVAKLEEAEIMVDAGIKNMLLAFPISRKEKIERLKQLSQKVHMIAAVDSIGQAKALQDSFAMDQLILEVWIKVNSGLNRCGVEPNEEVLELASYISGQTNLILDGLFTHAGHSYAASNTEKIKQIAKEEASSITKSAQLCAEAGIEVKHRSVGSTPTFREAGKIEGITEVRPGNAVFFDMVQVSLGVAKIENCALTVLASVVSKKADRIIIDAGSKALSLDKGAHGNSSVNGHGYIIGYPELIIERLSEEHGIIPLNKEVGLEIGETIQIIPNHACATANLFDYYTVHQNKTVRDTWKVDARGMMR